METLFNYLSGIVPDLFMTGGLLYFFIKRPSGSDPAFWFCFASMFCGQSMTKPFFNFAQQTNIQSISMPIAIFFFCIGATIMAKRFFGIARNFFGKKES